MTPLVLVPLLSAFVIITYLALKIRGRIALSWHVPALASTVFLAWTLYAVLAEGLFGFWRVATASLWGTQFWIDLLLAFAVGVLLMAPRARTAGMHLPLWLIAIVTTGSIGLLAMLARLLWLEARRTAESA
jgi:hypothetical protein